MAYRYPNLSNQNLDEQDRESLIETTRRLLAEMQAISSRIAAVQEIATAINRSLDLDSILDIVGHQAKWLLDFNHCSVYLKLSEVSDEFLTLFGPPIDRAQLEEGEQYGIELAMRTRQSQFLRKGEDTPPHIYRSQMILPLESERQVLGTINFASHETNIYTQDDMRIAYLLAVQLANALRNAERFQEVTRLYSELQVAEKMRDDLTHMIVHDLRTPLSVMLGTLGLVQMMQGKISQEDQHRFFSRAQGAADRMMGMIDDMLSVSKLESETLVLQRAPQNLNEVVREHMEAYEVQAEMQDRKVRFVWGENLPLVALDAKLIGRVVDNLVSNAVKYAESEIVVSTAVVDHDIQLAVQDDGPGIPPLERERIFDKFAQVTDEQGAPLRSGTGLGLTFCRLVMDAHHGRIWVEAIAEPAQGSCFVFSLPLDPKNEK